MNKQDDSKKVTSEAVAELWVKLLFAHIEANKQAALKTTVTKNQKKDKLSFEAE